MCGIVGIIAKNKNTLYSSHQELFTEMLYADGLRGMDSTGVFKVTTKNQINILKQATNPGLFCMTKSYQEFLNTNWSNNRIVIGHNRKATVGEVVSENAHPFMDKHIVLVHNGYISNHKSIDSAISVDSQSIISALLQEQTPAKALDRLSGAWSIVWYNHKTKHLYLATNGERPLAVGQTDNHIFVASEWDMLTWLLKRSKIPYKEVLDLPENTLIEIGFGPFTYKQTKLEEKPWVPFHQNSYYDSAFVLEGDPDPGHAPIRQTQEEIEERRASANVDLYDAGMQDLKLINKQYPPKSYTLFWPTKVFPDKALSLVTVIGRIWKPGHPQLTGLINIKTTEDDECYINPEVPLLGKVDCISRRNQSVRILLSSINKASAKVKDINGTNLSHEEWAMICNFKSCESCAKKVSREQIDFTRVQKKIPNDELQPIEYIVTCQDCIAKETTHHHVEKDNTIYAG